MKVYVLRDINTITMNNIEDSILDRSVQGRTYRLQIKNIAGVRKNGILRIESINANFLF